jgi:hypothetical protein
MSWLNILILIAAILLVVYFVVPRLIPLIPTGFVKTPSNTQPLSGTTPPAYTPPEVTSATIDPAVMAKLSAGFGTIYTGKDIAYYAKYGQMPRSGM